MKLREAFVHMRKFYKMLHRDHPFILVSIVIGGIAAGIFPFISLFFSSRILDALILGDMELAKQQIVYLLAGNTIVACIDRICAQAVD